MAELAKVERLELPPGRRILVMSDIHGNLPYFEGLLKKLGFSERDELIIDGDFLEKGAESLPLLRRLMALSAAGHTHCLNGNCDTWFGIFRPEYGPEDDRHFLHYMQNKRCGLLWDMCRELGIDPMAITDFTPVKTRLRTAFPTEWDFLRELPDAIETENFVFAHAGMTPGKPLREHRRDELNRIDRFLDRPMRFDKWLIVGHYPVVLYGENIVCADPIIDRAKHVICLDGGCVLKDDGQLNALIIPDKDSEDFSFAAYDPFPEYTVLEDQAEGPRSYYIRWGDSRVQVLRRGREFSRCRHVRTGYEMEILTKYLFTEEEFTNCNDCTDYVLPLKKGELVRVVERTSRGYLVKRGGTTGWYFGTLGSSPDSPEKT